MNAIIIDDEMEIARRSLGLPGCNHNSNIHIFRKIIPSNGIFLFNPPEEYQLYFLLQGRLEICDKKRKIHIPGETLFFLSRKDGIHFKSDSECVLLIVCFREISDTVNVSYFKSLAGMDEYKIDPVFPLLPIPEKIKTFALNVLSEAPNGCVYPTTLELLFTLLRAFLAPVEMAGLFKGLVLDIAYMGNENRNNSVDLRYQAIDLNT